MALALPLSITLTGQISLQVSDLPSPGDIQISVKTDSVQATTLAPGNAGADVLWDYSYLLPCCGNLEASYDTVTWENHDATSNAAYFPLSNIVQKDECYIYHSHVTHLDETVCYYNHYIKDPAGLLFYGLEKPVNALFENYLNIFPLLAYGDSIAHNAKIHIPISSDSLLVYHIEGYSIADAWGTLTTPATTAPAIRIFTSETIYDTLYVNGIVEQANAYPGNYYYKWYTKDLGFPLLEISKGYLTQQFPFVQQVKYAKTSIVSATDDDPISAVLKNIKVYPNPFSTNIAIQFSLPESEKVSAIIYDIMGKEIYAQPETTMPPGTQQIVFDPGNLNPGAYYLRMNIGDKSAFIKVIPLK